MNRLGLALAFCLALIASAHSQGGMGPGPGTVHSTGGAYTGPGDVVSGATAWGSCARVYNASLASTSTSMCDLVDSAAPTVVICTLRGSSTGYVDLAGAYCTGSVTPAVKCAAATGGVCNVSKMYDQAGATGGFLQASAATQPVLQFSSLNGLPGLKCISTAPTSLVTAGSVTLAQPFSLSTVGERTANFTTAMTWLGATSNNLIFGPDGNSNTWKLFDPSIAGTGGVAAADSAFHAAQGVIPTTGGTLTLSVDGTSGTGTAGGTGITTSLRICRGNAAVTPDGVFMEGGFWPSAFSGGNITSMNSNQHSATVGYNF